jgi:methionine-rich copper-binding protein CopC
MKPIQLRLAPMIVAACVVASTQAQAHAFLDHADPAVGSAGPTAPPLIKLWFTEHIEPAFSTATVTNAAGQRVDRGNPHVPSGHPAELDVGLKPLPNGTYTVHWHVISVDTHMTEGTFNFSVGG